MKPRTGQDFHLTYCLNIHPGESWEEQKTAIARWASEVKSRVSPDAAFGLGLRIGCRAAAELSDPRVRRDVRSALEGAGFYAFTVNAFPYGAFHGTAVKEAVYAPDWRTRERLDYTIAVAEILADLLPEGVDGSISTVPCSYRKWIRSEEEEKAMVSNLAAIAEALESVERRTGKRIALALEPEPDCFLETTADCVRFWNRALLPWGVAALGARAGGVERAEACLRRRIGVCLDTCHMALQFESPEASLRALAAEGIAVPKVQLSAAPRGPVTADVVTRLGAFVDKVYLHQTRIKRSDLTVEKWGDLTEEALSSLVPDRSAEIRSHFHVPLHFRGAGDLGSTVGDLTSAFFQTAMRGGCRHLEIETYTYGVLPEELRAASVAESIVREYVTVFDMLSTRVG